MCCGVSTPGIEWCPGFMKLLSGYPGRSSLSDSLKTRCLPALRRSDGHGQEMGYDQHSRVGRRGWEYSSRSVWELPSYAYYRPQSCGMIDSYEEAHDERVRIGDA